MVNADFSTSSSSIVKCTLASFILCCRCLLLDVQGADNFVNHPRPIEQAFLPKDAHTVVPRCAVAMQTPAPIWIKTEQQPALFPQSTGQVRNRGIDRDH